MVAAAVGRQLRALNTSTSTGGPPVVLPLMGRGLSPRVVRDTLTVAFIGFAGVSATALALTGTSEAIPDAGWIAALVPLDRGGPAGRPAAVRAARRRTAVRARAHCCPARHRGGGPAERRWGRLADVAQEHGDRLTAVDASFVAQEGPVSHMHIGAVMIFEGPAPAYEDLADHIRSRLHLVPRFRQSSPSHPSRRAARSGSTTRASTSSTTSATPRCRRPAPRRSCARSPRGSTPRRSTAPSRCGRCGSSRGSTTAASR